VLELNMVKPGHYWLKIKKDDHIGWELVLVNHVGEVLRFGWDRRRALDGTEELVGPVDIPRPE